MTISDEELRVGLERRAGSAHRVDLVDAARAVAVAPNRPGRARRPRLLAFVSVAASVAVALSLAGSLMLRRDGSAPSSSASNAAALGSAGPSSSAFTPPSATTPERWTDLVWSLPAASAFAFDGNTFVQGGIANGRGFIAIGYTAANGTTTGRIWLSQDGSGWASLTADWLANVELDHIVRIDGGFAIVGVHRPPEGEPTAESAGLVVFRSTDGTVWEEVTPLEARNQVVRSVAGGPAGLLLMTQTQGTLTLDVNYVADPDLHWQRFDQRWPDDVRLFGVGGGRTGWIATGAIGAGSATTMRPGGTLGSIWTSQDGGTWSAAAVGEPGGVIDGVLNVGSVFVAFGSEHSLRCEGCLGAVITRPSLTTWVSADGRSWRRATTFASGPGFRMATSIVITGPRIAGDGDRLLLFDTNDDFQPIARQSIDGETWTDVRNLHAKSATSDEVASMSGFDGPIIVGSDAVIAFHYGPDDPNSASYWPAPILATPTAGPADPLATFLPNPRATPNDVVCPNQEPCGP